MEGGGKMHQVKRYHCDYCRRTLAKKSDMEKHEKRCPHNPESRSCGTCAHLTYHTERCDTREIPVCELGQFDPGKRTERNPYGMRSDCPSHATDPYRF